MACAYIFSARRRQCKAFAFLLIIFFGIVVVRYSYNEEVIIFEDDTEEITAQHETTVEWFYHKRDAWKTSKLGSILFKNKPYPELSDETQHKTFVILIWKVWDKIKNRHVYYFGETEHDPLGGCSVSNCIFTGEDDYIRTADAVVVHLHRGRIPQVKNRNLSQRWIFLNDESPHNVFALARKKPKYSELGGLFNWSMTYRSDSDVPVPYGRTVALKAPRVTSYDAISNLVPNWETKRRDVLIAILMSNCVAYRMNLIKELKQYFTIHVYGKCGDDNDIKNSCPGHFKADCPVLSQYVFYLVLENSKCKEYMTEKLFYNAYSRGAIPIIQGPSMEECESFLPPNSYLHLDSYANVEDLADDLLRIASDDANMLYYHSWRLNFDVLNEHGYFGTKSFHLCRLCEAMNYNDNKTSVYSENDLKRFLDPELLCKSLS